MNTVLLKKAIYESRALMFSCAGLLFAIQWLRVWVASYFTENELAQILGIMPEFMEQLLPVSISQLASTVGRIAVGYDDPIALLTVTAWAVARGSDAVSGELNRGTMELLLAQPVTRLAVIGTQGAMTLAGGAFLAASAWMGTSVGLALVKLEESVSPYAFTPAAINLFAITAFLAGLSTMISSATNVRSRTIGIVGAIYAVSMVMKIIGRLVPDWHWLAYGSFFTPFEPQWLVSHTVPPWSMWARVGGSITLGGLGYDSILIGLGLTFYVVGTLIFCRRDLPAPL